MFQPVGPFDLVALEHEVLTRWREHDVFAESLRRREGSSEWVFYEGPPTANGRPGIHHVWARLFKDVFPRFRTMQGHHVARKGGWDCHGLPVEVEIEKELGLTSKHQIEDFGIEAFNQRCRESVHRYVEDWGSLTSRIGMWLDTANAYWTLDNEFIETVWWLFHRMWEQGDIYEGDKVVPYCGRCGTALSSHELGQPDAYRDVTEPSVYVRFPVVDRDFDLVVWTTTPWTLISNVAAAVGPDVEYVRVRDPQGGRDLVLASARVDAVLGEGVDRVETVAVSDLVGLHYERPFTVLPIEADANRVVAADFVTVDDGSGIVHLAPAFGEIDREVAVVEHLPVLNPVGPDARFDARVPQHRGTFVKDADPALIEELGASGRLVAAVDYTHSYPHCWRCSTPLIYWAKPTWFARTSAHRADLLRENESIGWHPEHIKHGRFGNWLENNVDWALSRDRYWGTPIPVWRCKDCGHDTCVGSVAELAKLADSDLSGLDLHRPYVDDVVITCPDCSGRAFRIEPVLDAWFDSGSMPAAQFHYPFENSDVFERRFPADFICEAIDQTRGWFYSLLAVNTLVFGHTPYRNVVCLGLLLDQDGQKMSKSRGNVIDPRTILESRGADALRWNMFSVGSPWVPRRVNVDNIDESTRRFLITLWNTYSFFVTYARLDGWEPEASDAAVADPTHVLDRWVRSRLDATVTAVTDALSSFDALSGAQALEEFVSELSNWYVRRSRPRFWKSSDPAAHTTLHECLRTVTLLLAPYCPFVADEMYANLASTSESVHLADWPVADASRRIPTLDAEMDLARAVTSLGRSARVDARIGTRQPLPRAFVVLPSHVRLRDEVVAEIATELNVKQVETVASLEGLLDYTVVPNFKALGPRLGKLLPRVRELVVALDGAAVRRALDEEGSVTLDVDGQTVTLGPDDLVVRAQQHEDLTLAQDGELAVALDLTLDDALRAEGAAREVVRLVNDRRKADRLDLADRIRLTLYVGGKLADALRTHAGWIAGEVLAVDLQIAESGGPDDDAVIDGQPLAIALQKV
ncbi:MAG TPA: isoleucine--tRNA ligase [Acidimicrobiia bacterium]|nr:isoleucine--tRNA ligase [Acidimicrobiia bacterium]